MNKQEKQSKGFPSGYVLVDRRANSSHPIFKGDGLTLAIWHELVARMAHEPTTDSLGKTKNEVPLKRKQSLTSFRTLGAAMGVGKHLIEPRIKKLVDGLPPYRGQAEVPGLIAKTPCEKMKGLSRNDGMVITILGGAKFGSAPDSSQDTESDNSSNSK